MANIGIDLGTTHSLVAVVIDGQPRCLLDDDERALLPSAVRYDAKGQPICVGYPRLGRRHTARRHHVYERQALYGSVWRRGRR